MRDEGTVRLWMALAVCVLLGLCGLSACSEERPAGCEGGEARACVCSDGAEGSFTCEGGEPGPCRCARELVLEPGAVRRALRVTEVEEAPSEAERVDAAATQSLLRAESSAAKLAAAWTQHASRELAYDVGALPGFGAEEPLVTVVAFVDLQGPFTKRLEPILEELVWDHPEEVRVVIAQRPLALHAEGELASRAALAAHEQGKFREMYERILENQNDLEQAQLEGYAESLELDVERFRASMQSAAVEERLAADRAYAKHRRITKTPSVLVNGVPLLGSLPQLRYESVVRQELERARRLEARTGLQGEALFAELVRTAPDMVQERRAPAPPDSRQWIDTAEAPSVGPREAPVTVVAFTDFQCRFCSRGAKTLQKLVERNPGVVRVAFMHHPLAVHEHAMLAHQASIAAHEQGAFWAYHDRLFAAGEDELTREHLLAYAEELELDVERFERDLDAPSTRQRVEADIAQAARVGVRGSPHFFVNGTRFSGAQPISAFQDTLDRELGHARALMARGVPAQEVYRTIVHQGDVAEESHLTLEGAPARGPEDAPVTIVLFSDFECPFCKKALPTLEVLFKAYPGKLRLVFKQLPLEVHRRARQAAQASLAAHEQGQFWAFHDRLFADTNSLRRERLEAHAEAVGLDMARFREALDSGRFEAQVDSDIAEARSFGISGTPSFLINGEKFVGAQPLQRFREEIELRLRGW